MLHVAMLNKKKTGDFLTPKKVPFSMQKVAQQNPKPKGNLTTLFSGSFGGLYGVPWTSLFWPFWGYVGPMLGPCGTYVGPMLDHVLAVGAMLGPS